MQMDRLEVVQEVINKPHLLLHNSDTLAEIKEIYDYYCILQGNSPNNSRIVTSSKNNLYAYILAYLINRQQQTSVVSRKGNIENNIKNFLENYTEGNMTFEIPNANLVPDFMKYATNLSMSKIERNIFNFKIGEPIEKPVSLTNDSQSSDLIYDVHNYYNKLHRGRKSNILTSLEQEYVRILVFLMNKKTKLQLLDMSSDSIKNDFQAFLKEFNIFSNPDYTLTFEIPYAPVVDGLIEFTEKFTKDAIGRNPFVFKVLK